MAEPGSLRVAEPGSGRPSGQQDEQRSRRWSKPPVVGADEFRNTGGGGAMSNLTTATSVGRGKVTDSAPDPGG